MTLTGDKTQTETGLVGPPLPHPNLDFHVIQGQVIVATIAADCVECAFKIRDEKYPGGIIGWICDEHHKTGHCTRTEDPVEAYYRAGYTKESAQRVLAYQANRPPLQKR